MKTLCEISIDEVIVRVTDYKDEEIHVRILETNKSDEMFFRLSLETFNKMKDIFELYKIRRNGFNIFGAR